jgi:hypothetical protein
MRSNKRFSSEECESNLTLFLDPIILHILCGTKRFHIQLICSDYGTHNVNYPNLSCCLEGLTLHMSKQNWNVREKYIDNSPRREIILKFHFTKLQIQLETYYLHYQ